MNIVAIVILNWNSVKDTIECVNSIGASEFKNYKIFILDNGSTNDIDLLFQKFKSNSSIILLKSEINLGFSGGNNKVVEYINNIYDYKYILLLNNDTIIQHDMLSILVNAADNSEEEEVLFIPKIFYHSPNLAMDSVWHPKYMNKTVNTNQRIKISRPVGCAFFIKNSYIKKRGLFYSDYFAYNEDNDFVYFLRKNRFNVLYVPAAVLWHKVVEHHDSSFKVYMIIRNKWRFLQRQTFPDSIIYLAYLLIYYFPKKAVKYCFSKVFYAYVKGFFHGIYWCITNRKIANPFIPHENKLNWDVIKIYKI